MCPYALLQPALYVLYMCLALLHTDIINLSSAFIEIGVHSINVSLEDGFNDDLSRDGPLTHDLWIGFAHESPHLEKPSNPEQTIIENLC